MKKSSQTIVPIFDEDNVFIGIWSLNPDPPEGLLKAELLSLGEPTFQVLKNNIPRLVANISTDIGNGVIFKNGAFLMLNGQQAPNETLADSNSKITFTVFQKNGLACMARDGGIPHSKIQKKDESEDNNEKWYLLKDKNKNVRQITIELPIIKSQEPIFGSIGLAAKYKNLFTQKWVTGFIKMDGYPSTYLLVRVDEYLEYLKNNKLKVVFSFHQEPNGGIFGILVHVKSSELASVSQSQYPIIEGFYGLDVQDNVNRFIDGLKSNKLHICFAQASANLTQSIIDESGNFTDVSPPECIFDKIFNIPDECTKALLTEFDSLISYHRSISEYDRNYQMSMQQLFSNFPLSTSPILKISNTDKKNTDQLVTEKKQIKELCPNCNVEMEPWSGKLRCWTCGYPDSKNTPSDNKNSEILDNSIINLSSKKWWEFWK